MTKEVFQIMRNRADKFMSENHYLGGAPNSSQPNFGLFDGGNLEAVACYGPCHMPKFPKTFLELRRLARTEKSTAPLSVFLAKTLRELKKRGVPAVVTWADPEAGHHGGIYQATNWIYNEPNSYNWNSHFKTEDGKIVDHREAFSRFGTSSKVKVLAINPEWIAFLPAMKYRYAMPLNISKEECLRLINGRELPYPKPEINGPREKRISSKWRVR